MFAPFAEPARAKINLALHVLGRRADGYHELDSVVAFAEAADELHFTPSEGFGITVSGRFASDLPPAAGNIIARAHESVSKIAAAQSLALPPVAIHLTKNLPVASGIGGGSANAAAALRGLLKIAGIGDAGQQLLDAALALGADVPVCLTGRACRMQGIGERIQPLDRLRPRRIVLVNPGVPVETASVFRKLGLARGEAHAAAIADLADPAGWRNDLTRPAIAVAPVIGDVLEALQSTPGLTDARMSGSGATCFGFIEGDIPESLSRLAAQRGWWLADTRLAIP